MKDLNVEVFKKDGFSYEEIESIKISITDFEKTGITHNFKDVKKTARKKIFSEVKQYV